MPALIKKNQPDHSNSVFSIRFHSFIYEVVWFRKLALIFGNTALATSTILTLFFAGLAIGSVLFGRIADRTNRRLLLYGVLEAGIGIYALIFPFCAPFSYFHRPF